MASLIISNSEFFEQTGDVIQVDIQRPAINIIFKAIAPLATKNLDKEDLIDFNTNFSVLKSVDIGDFPINAFLHACDIISKLAMTNNELSACKEEILDKISKDERILSFKDKKVA